MKLHWLIGLFFLCAIPSQASVGILNHTGNSLPTQELRFHDDSGKLVALDSYFHRKMPVILMPVYFACPGVCNITLNNLLASLSQMNSSAGRAFEIVVFSFDPKDTSALAAAKKKAYFDLYKRPETASGWHFLTGDKANITLLTNTLGFQYEYVEASQQFSHSSALFILSADGRISSIMEGVTYPHKELQRRLYEASHGRVEIFVSRLSALCYAYMPHFGLLNSPFRWFLLILGFFFALGFAVAFVNRFRQ